MVRSNIRRLIVKSTSLSLTLLSTSFAGAFSFDINIKQSDAPHVLRDCELAQPDVGLNQTRGKLIQLASLISPDGIDHRETVSRAGKGNPLTAIGKLRTAHPININPDGKEILMANSEGVAFLIAPCLVLTNDHAVHGFNTSPKPDADYTMIFEVGDKSAGNVETALAHIETGGDLTNGYKINEDWTVLRLERDAKTNKCIGDHVGWFNLPTDENASKIAAGKYISAGFPVDRDRTALTIQRNCTLSPGALNHELTMRTTCPSLHGDSGGPIFQISSTGAPVAVAMSTWSTDGSSVVHKTLDAKSMNRAIDLYLVNSNISALVQQDVGSTENLLGVSHVAPNVR